MCKAIQDMLEDSRQEGRQEGVEEGVQIGIDQGVQIGIDQGIEKVAVNLLENNVPMDIIARSTGLTEAEILALADTGKP